MANEHVNRSEFLEILKAVSPGLARKDLIAQAECFIFANGRCATYNDIVAVSHPLPESCADLAGAVKAEELLKLISRIRNKTVKLETDEKNLVIRTPSAQMGVRVENDIVLPLAAIGAPDEWLPIPEGMLKAISFCRFSAGQDQARPILTYVLLRENAAISSDDLRITVMEFDKPLCDRDILIPAEHIKELISYKPIEFGRDEGWLHFRNESGVTFSLRTAEDAEYMDLTDHLDVVGVSLELPTKELKASVQLAMDVIPAKEPDPVLKVTCKDGKMLVKADGPYAWVKCRHKIETDEVFQFLVHPQLFLDTLDLADEVIVGTSCIRIASKKARFVHVVLLCEGGDE